MLCEKLGLAVPQFGQMSLQRFGDLRMRLPADIAQQAAVLRVLHQRVLKAVNRIRGCAALKDQLRSDETRERPLQCVVWQTRVSAEQRVRKLPSDRRTNLRHLPEPS